MIGQETNGEYLSYHYDFRGSTVALTDSSKQVVERYQYSPYGLLLAGDASKTPFLFNGMYGVMSDGNGFYYMRARFYSPEIRRFINQDVLLGGIGEGQSLNRFAFVTGQPVSFVDPFGLAGSLTICTNGDGGLLSGHSFIKYFPENQNSLLDTLTAGTWGNEEPAGLHFNKEFGYPCETSRNMEIDEAGEKRLQEIFDLYARLGEYGWRFDNPCSGFAADAWNAATGEHLEDRNWGISNPSNLKESIFKANGGNNNSNNW